MNLLKVFSLPYYSVALPEDVEVGTLVTKIHAFDADIGINRKIKYSFIDSFNDHFVMAHDSGIVTLAKPLDREIRALYNLTVQAVDQGTPQLSSVTNLIVNVQDINDNPPEFENKYYFATVPEIDAVGKLSLFFINNSLFLKIMSNFCTFYEVLLEKIITFVEIVNKGCRVYKCVSKQPTF